jgi:hypothetical protein
MTACRNAPAHPPPATAHPRNRRPSSPPPPRSPPSTTPSVPPGAPADHPAAARTAHRARRLGGRPGRERPQRRRHLGRPRPPHGRRKPPGHGEPPSAPAPHRGDPHRPGIGAERVEAVRDRRAADRAVTARARDNASDLRVLAARITAAPGLTPRADSALAALITALGAPDPADLITPLTDMRPHLADRLHGLTDNTERLRRDSDRPRT